jgi:hypothetical protein
MAHNQDFNMMLDEAYDDDYLDDEEVKPPPSANENAVVKTNGMETGGVIDTLYEEIMNRETAAMQEFEGGKIIVADDICTHIEIIKSKMKKMGMD